MCDSRTAEAQPALRRAVAAVLAAGLSFLLAACDGGRDASSPPAVPGSGIATLTDAGGTVTGVDGATLVVPAGALGSTLTLAVARESTNAPTLPASVKRASGTYAITPHYASFSADATVRIPFDADRVGANEQPVLLKAAPGSAGPWQVLTNVTVQDGFVIAPVRSLSCSARIVLWWAWEAVKQASQVVD